MPATHAFDVVQVCVRPHAGQLTGIGTRGSVANSTQSELTPVEMDAPVCGHFVRMIGMLDFSIERGTSDVGVVIVRSCRRMQTNHAVGLDLPRYLIPDTLAFGITKLA